jgi:hypothetical protein
MFQDINITPTLNLQLHNRHTCRITGDNQCRLLSPRMKDTNNHSLQQKYPHHKSKQNLY